MAIADDRNPSRDFPRLTNVPGMEDVPVEARTDPTNSVEVGVSKGFAPDSGPQANDTPGGVDLPHVDLSQQEAPTIVAGSDPYLGRQFGGYELVQKVGQGGMGLVYKGRQVSLDRVVAVKILNKSLCDNQEFIKRFEREAKSIARINHPNIMAVYDFGQTEGMWYMVVEYIEGSSLSKRIADRLMLPVEELAPLLVQCLAGLAHVGMQGIVHRDIKPDNILITKDGVAKIADFGLAKDVSRNDTTDLTMVGMAMGTPAYMSPEQCMGRKLDGRSDVYSLGVTAYLALTGEKPFTGQSSFEIMTKQREYNPPPPAKLNPAVPREVSDLVLQMLAKNPNDRFQDAEMCRQVWVQLGASLGFLSGANSGMEPALRGSEMLKSTRSSPTIPAIPASASAPTSLTLAPMSSPPSAAPLAPPGPSDSGRPSAVDAPPKSKSRSLSDLGSHEFEAPNQGQVPNGKVGSDRQQRPTTERRLSLRAGQESATCPRCGMLNRASTATCQRCGHELRDTSQDPAVSKDLNVEAQRQFAQGNFREAAESYARLADRENDKRARAILRSKEREARTLAQLHHVDDLQNRSQGLLNRGDIKAGIDLLERGLRDVRDSGASSTGAEGKLVVQINDLRSKLRRRQRMRLIITVVVVVVVLMAALFAHYYFNLPAMKTAAIRTAPPADEC